MSRWVTRRRAAVVLTALLVVSAGAWQLFGRAVVPDVPTADVTRGDYSDVIEIRGDVRPVRSTMVAAPANSGELVIMKIARNGTVVKKGDVVAEFDAVTMRRTIADKQSELRTKTAELEQARAQSKITLEERATAVRRAAFEVEKAKLNILDGDLVAPIEAERARLALLDAEQRLKEAQAAEASAKASVTSDFASRDRSIEKVRLDLQRAEAAVKALQAVAPADGVVNILPNYRSASPMGVAAEYRPGDKTFAGATILELPDLSSVFLVARIDEADRGPLRPGLEASIRADAIPDREYRATISEVSLLARVDYMNWPPQKLFDLRLGFVDPDDRLRPGMSAVARVPVGELEDVLLVPASAVFTEGGASVVFRLGRRGFSAVPVSVVRRGREQAVVEGALTPGDRIATSHPNEAPGPGGAK
jgi:multidrug efflux pump subunit AcrA (membrane-fusion protein)